MSHPNVELLERLFGAFGRDRAALADAFTPDATWRVTGANRMTGEYQGSDAILAFLRETAVLTNGSYRAELRYALADDERAVAVYRASGQRDGLSIDIDQALFCVVRDGRLADITAVPFDAAAFDAFWA